MAEIDGDETAFGDRNAYEELLKDQEAKEANGRRVLLSDGGEERHVERTDVPSALLSGLRAGQPVTVSAFKLPVWARQGINPSVPVIVYPDGRVEPT